jgi:transposase-like protein
MSTRSVPFHCPYCGDEDLRPHSGRHGDWECRACLRAFSLHFLGLLTPTTDTDTDAPASETDPR